MHEERFFDESSKNAKIQNIEDDILKICNSIDIVENLKNIKSKLDDFCAEKICFYVSKFYFDKYGILNVECKYITNPLIIMKTNCISEEELKDTFSTTVGNRFDEDLYILDDFENKIKIETIFKKLVDAIYVKDVSVSTKNETYVISGFTAFADEIIELIS